MSEDQGKVTERRHPSTQKILTALAEARFAARKRGAPGRPQVSHFDLALNKSAGYLSRILRNEIPLDLDVLFTSLELFGVSPERFFSKLFSVRSDLDGLLYEVEKENRDNDEEALDRVESKWQLERQEESRETDGSSQEMLAVIRGVDDLWMVDAAEALQRAEAFILKLIHRSPVEWELVCRCLAALASIYLANSYAATAARSLRLALQLAKACDFREVMSDLLRRGALLLGESGYLEDAAGFALEAMQESLLRHDHDDLGLSLLHRAILLSRLGQAQRARDVFVGSLKYLAPNNLRGRFEAYRWMGYSCYTTGDLDAARECSEKALDILPGLPAPSSTSAIAVRWLQGKIAVRSRNFSQAEKRFRQVAELLTGPPRPIEVAAVALERANALLHLGRMADLRAVATEMAGLLAALRGHKEVEKSVGIFARRTLAGGITLRKLEHLCEKIKREFPSGHPFRTD